MRNVLLLMLLAACQPGAPQAPERAQGRVVAEPTVAQQAPPAPKHVPPRAAQLTSDGYGPLRIGMTRGEVERIYGPDVEPGVGGPEPETCDVFHPSQAPDGLMAMVEDGRLTRLSLIEDAKIKTADGFGLGASAKAIRAKLASRIVESAHEYVDPPGAYLDHWQSGREPAEDDKAARGIRYEINQNGVVSTVHAGGPSIRYVEGCL